jgi:hypothetical protein
MVAKSAPYGPAARARSGQKFYGVKKHKIGATKQDAVGAMAHIINVEAMMLNTPEERTRP